MGIHDQTLYVVVVVYVLFSFFGGDFVVVVFCQYTLEFIVLLNQNHSKLRVLVAV